MERDAKAGLQQHGKVVGTVSYGNGLGNVHLFCLGNKLEEVCLAAAVHNVSHIAAGELAVFSNFQFVGVDVVNAVFALQILSEEGEAAAEDGNFVAAGLENAHEAVGAFRDGQVLGNVLHYRYVQALQECNPLGETLFEIDLSPHGALGDGRYLIIDPVAAGEFINAFCLNERGVHIKADEPAHAAVHVVFLEGEVHAAVGGKGHELLLESAFVFQRAADGEFHAGTDVALRVLDAHAAREALDGVDIEAVTGDNLCGRLDLTGTEASADDREDVAVFALATGPGLVFVVGDGLEADVHANLRSLEQEFFHNLAGGFVIYADEDTQGKGTVNIGLADVQDLCVIPGQDGHNLCGKANAVFAGNAN